MRKRMISPELWADARVLKLGDNFAKLIFVGLISASDDEGIVELDGGGLRAALALKCPVAKMDMAVGRVVEVGLVVEYEADGQRFGFLPGFFKHQSLDRPTPTKHPRPPDDLLGKYPGYVKGRSETFNRSTSRHKGLFPGGSEGVGEGPEKGSRRRVGDESATSRHEISGDEIRKDHVAADKPPPDSRIREFQTCFGEKYQRRFHAPYVPAFGADGKALKAVLAALDGAAPGHEPLDTLKAAVERFFQDDSARQFGGHTLRNFCGRVNCYLVGDGIAAYKAFRAQKEAAQDKEAPP